MISVIYNVVKYIWNSGKIPSVDYGGVTVGNRTFHQHAGQYSYTDYFLMIKNQTKNTTAEKCPHIYQYLGFMQYGKSLTSLSIGKEESIKLFTRSDFKSPPESKMEIVVYTRTGDAKYTLDENILDAVYNHLFGAFGTRSLDKSI